MQKGIDLDFVTILGTDDNNWKTETIALTKNEMCQYTFGRQHECFLCYSFNQVYCGEVHKEINGQETKYPETDRKSMRSNKKSVTELSCHKFRKGLVHVL